MMDDPESLLNSWLEELDTLTVGLENGGARPAQMTSDLNTPRIDSYRFSMANLEETLDADLDAILGELCALETKCDEEIAGARLSKRESRCDQPRSRIDATDDHTPGKHESVGRTDSPDNDSAFSDNVSLLSSESSASSGASKTSSGLGIDPHPQNETAHRIKAEKIRIALEKMKQAAVKKLFIKAFTSDGSTKSLLVDEKMTCSFVTRLLADKNHVNMEPKWGLVEHLPDLYMERVYEDHELLVENLMLWTRDSPNTILFHERPDKYQLFRTPETFLLSSDAPGAALHLDMEINHDSHSRAMLLEEFFSHAHAPEISGPLYLKTDSRKCWKRYQFVLRASGLYYYPKEKSKSLKDLSCLASFDVNQVYYGVGWRKKYKAPTDFGFAIKHPRLQQSKSSKYIKYLCAEDNIALQRWVVGIRIAKYGRQLLDNYRTLLDDMAQEDLDLLAHARSCSTASIAHAAESHDISFMRLDESEMDRRNSMVSCASSSSSSGCHSDGVSGSETGFLSDYPSGTIKRKPPTIQPKIPLTSMTRQLIEASESVEGGTLTRRASWRRSQTVDETGQGTLTRGRSLRAQLSTEEPGSQSTLTRGRSLRPQLFSEEAGNDSTLTRSRALKTQPSNEDGRSECVRPVRPPESDESGNQSTLTRRRSLKEVSRSSNDSLEKSKLSTRATLDPATVLSEASRTLNEAVNNLLAESNGVQVFPIAMPPVNSHFEEAMERDLETISDHSSSFGEEEKVDEDELPPPPEMFESTLSLDSLPPPPSQSDLPAFDTELSCSSLSLASLPPYPQASSPKSDLSTPISSGDATPTNGTPTHNKVCRGFDIQSGRATPTNNNSLTRKQPTRTDSPNSGEVTPTNSGSLTRNSFRASTESGRLTPNRTPPQSMDPGPVNSPLARGPSLRGFEFKTPEVVARQPLLQPTSGPKAPYYPPLPTSNSNISDVTTVGIRSSLSSSNRAVPINHVIPGSKPAIFPANSASPSTRHSLGPANVVAAACPPSFLPSSPRLPPVGPRRVTFAPNPSPPTPTKLAPQGNEFLKDLQRVMRKKWQVAQKCAAEPTVSPHEVLGFRDPPQSKEAHVSNWVNQHYGLYENVYNPDTPVPAVPPPAPQQLKKRPPPPPPKRSETTHLTTRMY